MEYVLFSRLRMSAEPWISNWGKWFFAQINVFQYFERLCPFSQSFARKLLFNNTLQISSWENLPLTNGSLFKSGWNATFAFELRNFTSELQRSIRVATSLQHLFQFKSKALQITLNVFLACTSFGRCHSVRFIIMKLLHMIRHDLLLRQLPWLNSRLSGSGFTTHESGTRLSAVSFRRNLLWFAGTLQRF